ncbi:MFS transporter [uncultured Gilliamella sp.]|uniref:MFS transporter n=1 Tax=uncultured Gilliamella sp. TaxID=1193505 RepID=UPI0025E89763|nr:MFS transporter [uncultured Gilliamella sp.]
MVSNQTTKPNKLLAVNSTQDVIDIINEYAPKTKRHFFIYFLALSGVFLDAYQVVIMAFANKYIAQEFVVSPTFSASVNSIFFVGLMIGGLIAQSTVDKIGQRRAFLLSIGLWIMGALMLPIVTNIWVLLFIFLLMGTGLGIDFPLSTSAVAELAGTKSKKSGGSVNLWQVVWFLTTTFVYLLLFILYKFDINEMKLWRVAFFIGALFAVIIIILRYRLIGESAIWAARVKRVAQLTEIIKKRYQITIEITSNFSISATTTDKSKPEKTSKISQYKILFSKKYLKRTILSCVIANMQSWQYNAVGAYLPVILISMFAGDLSASLLGTASVNMLAGLTGAITGSLLIAKLGTRKQSLIGFILVMLSLLALGFIGQSNIILTLLFLMTLIFSHAAGPAGLGITIATLSYPPSIRAAGIGFTNAVLRIGGIAGVIFWPLIWYKFGITSFYLLALVPLIGSLTCYLIKWEPLNNEVDKEDEEVMLLLKN